MNKGLFVKALASFLILFAQTSLAQLNPGDVVFSGYNSDVGSDGFSIIATTSISAGEVIHFTDNGWLSGTNTFRTGEGFISYTVPAGGLSLGDQVAFSDVTGVGNGYVASDGGSIAQSFAGNLNPALAGDQIFAFSGTVTNSTTFTVTGVIAGLHFRGTSFDADATSSNTSALPPDLTEGADAVAMNPSRDNGRLSFDTNFLGGSAASIKSGATNNSNWDHDNDIIYDLPPLPENTWDGAAWSSGSNPTAGQNATISTGQTLTVSSNTTIGELTVESGSTLSVDDGVTLTISGGDLTNSGTISGTGTISFDNNASISRTRGSTTSFEGVIEVLTGTTLETNDLLTLTASSSTSYGMIDGEGTVSGNVNIQCYLDLAGGASDGRYYHLASPITDTDFDDFNEGQNINVSSSSAGSVWQWDAANSNWSAPASSASTVENGKGYAMYAGSNVNGDFLISEAGTIELTGTVTSGDVPVSLSYNDGQALNVTFVGGTAVSATEGWNLLGNPYASQYDWDGQSFPSGLNNATYIYQGTGSFATYISNVGANNGTQYIAPFQAFWVQTTNSSSPGTFTFAAAQRVSSQSTELFKTTSVIDGVHLQVNDNQNASDEIFIGFDPQATASFDGQFDAWKLLNAVGVPNIYSKVGQDIYSINRVKVGDITSFDVGFAFDQHGTQMTIHLKDDQLKSYTRVVLEDLKTNALHDFDNGDYSFTNDTSFAADRFVLHFSNSSQIGLHEDTHLSWYAYSTDGGLMVKTPSIEKNAKLEIYNMAGQLICYSEHVKTENFFPLTQKGVHVIRLTEGGKTSFFKTIL